MVNGLSRSSWSLALGMYLDIKMSKACCMPSRGMELAKCKDASGGPEETAHPNHSQTLHRSGAGKGPPPRPRSLRFWISGPHLERGLMVVFTGVPEPGPAQIASIHIWRSERLS